MHQMYDSILLAGKVFIGADTDVRRMHLALMLFSHDLCYAPSALAAGFDAVVVDWEWLGKTGRQAGRDTQINRGTVRDLAAMRRATPGHLICRINNDAMTRRDELISAVDAGADEILLPMVRGLDEVDECFAWLPSTCRLGVMVETREALALGPGFSQRPLERVFVGLNDLSIKTGARNLFEPLVDGTVAAFRESYSGPFGVAGVTRPGLGRPLPCHLLLAEMARLNSSFAVARRTFFADVPEVDLPRAVAEIRHVHTSMLARTAAEVESDRLALKGQVAAMAAEGVS